MPEMTGFSMPAGRCLILGGCLGQTMDKPFYSIDQTDTAGPTKNNMSLSHMIGIQCKQLVEFTNLFKKHHTIFWKSSPPCLEVCILL